MGMNAGGGNPAGYVPGGARGARPGESFGPVPGTSGGGGGSAPPRRAIGGGYNGPTPVGGGGVNPGPINWNPPAGGNVPLPTGPTNPQPGPPLGGSPFPVPGPTGMNLGATAPAEGGVYNPNPLAPKGASTMQSDVAYPMPITDTINLGKPTFSGGYAPPPPQSNPATANAAKQGFQGVGVGGTKPGAAPVKMPPVRGIYPPYGSR